MATPPHPLSVTFWLSNAGSDRQNVTLSGGWGV